MESSKMANKSKHIYYRPIDTLSLGYIKLMKVFLTIPALWPYQVAGGKVHPIYRLHRRLVVGFLVVAASGQIWFYIDNFKILAFFELGHMCLTCFITILGVVRTLFLQHSKFGEILEKLLLYFHLIHFKQESKFHQKMYEQIEWLTHRVVVLSMLLSLICSAVFNMIPIMNNITNDAYRDPNKTLELAVFVSYPGFDPQKHYMFVTVCNFYLVACCSIIIGGVDVMILLFVNHITGHIVILHNTLMTFPKPGNPTDMFKTRIGRATKPAILTTTMYTLEENLMINDKIKQFVEYHLLIVRFTDDVSAFFGPMIAIYYLFHQISGCVVLLQLSAGGAAALTRYGPIAMAIFGQLIIISVFFEIVNTKSEQLAAAAYGVPWESMSVSNQISMCILLRRLQKPITVTAAGIIGVNVNNMSKILKTSFSYFTFLKSLNH